MKKLIIPLVLVFSTLSAQVVRSQSPQAEQQPLLDLIANYEKARDDADLESLQELFTQDADQLVSSGAWRRGIDALLKGMISSSNRNPGDRSIEVEKIRFLTEFIAIIDARYIIKGSDGKTDRKMWSTFMAKKESGRWRIAGIRNMLPASPAN
jgi:uncharacterized protein (TIGR02246 family)